MKVLVLGNGFDLAHDLKTSYNDFWSFLKEFKWGNYDELKIDNSVEDELKKIVNDNAFIGFVLSYDGQMDLWVDLEAEMRKITMSICEALRRIPVGHENNITTSERLFSEYELGCLTKFRFVADNLYETNGIRYVIEPYIYSPFSGVIWKNVKIKLHSELDGLKCALIIYLKYYMPEISAMHPLVQQIKDIKPDELITFNYTDTYKRYDFDLQRIVHVHGDLESNKIVLGYNDEDEEDLTLIDFKKYFQRIENKNTEITEGYLSKDVKGNKVGQIEVIIYGLSLDKTDEDIIKTIYKKSRFFNVYYLDDDIDYARKVTNLIDILGKKVFLQGYHSGRIIFTKIEPST